MGKLFEKFIRNGEGEMTEADREKLLRELFVEGQVEIRVKKFRADARDEERIKSLGLIVWEKSDFPPSRILVKVPRGSEEEWVEKFREMDWVDSARLIPKSQRTNY